MNVIDTVSYILAYNYRIIQAIINAIEAFLLILPIVIHDLRNPMLTTVEIEALFQRNTGAYHELKSMIIADTIREDCFAVGTDRIGDYRKYNGHWESSKNYEEKLGLSEVLQIVGLSEDRYRKYISLLKSAGGRRLVSCSDSTRFGHWLDVLIFSRGYVVDGCSGSIEWMEQSAPKQLGVRGKGDFSEALALGQGWYATVTCS